MSATAFELSPGLSQYCIAESIVKRDNSVVFKLLEKKDTIKIKQHSRIINNREGGGLETRVYPHRNRLVMVT